MRLALLAALFAILVPVARASEPYDPEREDRNLAKTEERERMEWGTPEFMARMNELSAREGPKLAAELAADPERSPTNVCGVFRVDACLGDVRLWDWEENGHGIVEPFLFTARSGATLSGRVWATRSGPAKRPLVVYVTGSVQVPEAAYWFVATTLAKHGYVVLTFDEQGEGTSDTFGEEPDRNEGVPAQAGQPFYSGAEDALDFALSTPASPYRPRPSCTTGTSHDAKQQRRVAEGRNAAFNPLWEMIDPARVGLAGQSFGAAAASYVGQLDPRVDAIVGHDNLRGSDFAAPPCPADPESRPEAVPLRTPALGISNDYGLLKPQRFESQPDPKARSKGSLALSEAGVDTMQVNIRGGTHQECAFVPLRGDQTPATRYGIDLCAWYTAAWMDKYVKGDPTADRRLLTRRWLADPRDAEIDPPEKGNLLSFYFDSRADIGLSTGGRAVCEDLRKGCRLDVGDDGRPPLFDRLALSLSPDEPRPEAAPPRLRGTRPAIAQRVAVLVRRLGPRTRLRVVPRGGFPGDVRRYELRAGGRRLRSRSGRFAVRLRAKPLRVRARAVDRLGGVGPWRARRLPAR
jgi:dienelactone hydrolase